MILIFAVFGFHAILIFVAFGFHAIPTIYKENQIYLGCVYNSLWTRPQTNSRYKENISERFTEKIVLIVFLNEKKNSILAFTKKKMAIIGWKKKELNCYGNCISFSFLTFSFKKTKINKSIDNLKLNGVHYHLYNDVNAHQCTWL